jgi:hypothetical protein
MSSWQTTIFGIIAAAVFAAPAFLCRKSERPPVNRTLVMLIFVGMALLVVGAALIRHWQ